MKSLFAGCRWLLVALSLAVLLPALAAEKKEPEAPPRSRTFLFTYNATVTGLKPEQAARIWLPVPPSNAEQTVKVAADKGLPKGHKISEESQYGNQILYVEAKADKDGSIPLSITYQVTRREVKGAHNDPTTAEQLSRFLEPDKLVPIDGKPLTLLKDKKLPGDELAAAHVLYDLVNGHMKYAKPEGKKWGEGNSVFACEEGVGNCSDFHSLFISLARSQKLPAKFEMGFPLPPKRGEGEIPGYHCWAKFNVKGKGWVPVDISEANKDPKMKDYYFGNLTEDRVMFSTGRDITLAPKQDGPPLNYFIFPYVEADGKPYPVAKIQKKFSFKDVPTQETD
jgi:transglutaminase-like putative cysteine protease